MSPFHPPWPSWRERTAAAPSSTLTGLQHTLHTLYTLYSNQADVPEDVVHVAVPSPVAVLERADGGGAQLHPHQVALAQRRRGGRVAWDGCGGYDSISWCFRRAFSPSCLKKGKTRCDM